MTNDLFNLETYNYDLPEELIAQTPIEPRDHSRLLIYNRKNSSIEHKHFYDIIDYLNSGDVLVVNNTKVIPARLIGYKTDTQAKIEIFLLKRNNTVNWNVLIKPLKRIKVDSIIKICDELSFKIKNIYEMGEVDGDFIFNGIFEEILDRVGSVPLPHYIKKQNIDINRYQTVYSKINGSSAAPTAGLHFTKELLDRIREKGVIITEVLLHVGLGTFRPVKDENILDHKMHSEYFEVTKESADIINNAKKNGKRIIAVGTTSVRTLESATNDIGQLVSQKRYTDIFIYPGYKYKIVDAIVTNFHLPKSSLIMLVSAFVGLDNMRTIYKTAVGMKYRFFSFGDATLLL